MSQARVRYLLCPGCHRTHSVSGVCQAPLCAGPSSVWPQNRPCPCPRTQWKHMLSCLAGVVLELGPVISRVEILGPSGSVMGTQVGGIAF